jgi:hypothetical protein
MLKICPGGILYLLGTHSNKLFYLVEIRPVGFLTSREFTHIEFCKDFDKIIFAKFVHMAQ